MNCQTSKENISMFLDNEIPAEQLQTLFRHLSECEECRKFFVQTKSIHDGVKKIANLSVPEEIDRKFAVLSMEEKKLSFMEKTFTVSASSALFSLGVVVFMTLFIYVVGTIQEKNLSAQYNQSFNVSQPQTTFFLDVN